MDCLCADKTRFQDVDVVGEPIDLVLLHYHFCGRDVQQLRRRDCREDGRKRPKIVNDGRVRRGDGFYGGFKPICPLQTMGVAEGLVGVLLGFAARHVICTVDVLGAQPT